MVPRSTGEELGVDKKEVVQGAGACIQAKGKVLCDLFNKSLKVQGSWNIELGGGEMKERRGMSKSQIVLSFDLIKRTSPQRSLNASLIPV